MLKLVANHFGLALAVLALSALSGCGESPRARAVPFAVAGLPPVAGLAARIAGPELTVACALPAGRSPHDYTPTPADIRDIAASGIFLQVGEVFEQTITKSLKDGKVRVIDVSASIERIPLSTGEDAEDHDHAAAPGHRHDAGTKAAEDRDHDHAAVGKPAGAGHGHEAAHAHGHGADCGCSADGLDPHVWLSPHNCVIIARNIAAAFSAAAPAHRETFERNLAGLVAELEALDAEMKAKLAPYAGRTFFVYHPAFGYLARATGLKQRGIELGGRDPSPAKLAEVIREAKEQGVKTIFVQKQFNPASARALAEAIGGDTIELDPVAPDVLASFRLITAKLIEGFAAK
jgi:zinc transport system substrate-binding protein